MIVFSTTSDAGSELAYRLPLTDAHKFSALFSKFEDEGPELGITTFGISVTTLEEVFLRVAVCAWLPRFLLCSCSSADTHLPILAAW
jgi:hypothetical protein